MPMNIINSCSCKALCHFMFWGLKVHSDAVTKNLQWSVNPDHIQQALCGLGLPYQDFARHCFHIGAATAAANAGIEDSIIRVGPLEQQCIPCLHSNPQRDCKFHFGERLTIGEAKKWSLPRASGCHEGEDCSHWT